MACESTAGTFYNTHLQLSSSSVGVLAVFRGSGGFASFGGLGPWSLPGPAPGLLAAGVRPVLGPLRRFALLSVFVLFGVLRRVCLRCTRRLETWRVAGSNWPLKNASETEFLVDRALKLSTSFLFEDCSALTASAV